MRWDYKVLITHQAPNANDLDEASREGYGLIHVLYDAASWQWYSYLTRSVERTSSIIIDDIDWRSTDIHHYDDGLDSPGGVMRNRFWEENGRWPEEDEY